MCGQKFELKIDNVRFVGHPTLLQHALGQVSKTDPSPKREAPTMILFNVVFALRANADPSVINCLHNLSRRIATVLQHEERRCQYLTREAKLILALQDEVSAMADGNEGPQSPFHHILPKCKLARDLKEAYDSLCTSGVVRLHINSWLEVSFCLPHKIHYAASSLIPPEAIERSLKAIRPYHALLLLSDEKSLLSELPVDCSPALVRVIKTTSAVKNLQQLAQDADLALLQSPAVAIWQRPLGTGVRLASSQPILSRLLHYFRGRHHLEEIMYNENTRRSQLLMLFDKFRSVLVVTTHEDPVIAVFQALLP
ncbi:GATOR complex protein NPRL3 [Sapajus apella]|uniref:GATOR complex protein NPRL3 n=1 Tax=Sapajus apella TaxID=9515 RepID=A0A6J3H478_SAPAP|nr:GATOR complex protein NPRL3 [Sapajus apella]